jgi:hypothetical protein
MQRKRIFEKLVSALQKTCSVPLTKTRSLITSMVAVGHFLRIISKVHCLMLNDVVSKK